MPPSIIEDPSQWTRQPADPFDLDAKLKSKEPAATTAAPAKAGSVRTAHSLGDYQQLRQGIHAAAEYIKQNNAHDGSDQLTPGQSRLLYEHLKGLLKKHPQDGANY